MKAREVMPMMVLAENTTMVRGGVDDVGGGDDGDGPRASACPEARPDTCPTPRKHRSEVTYGTLQISRVGCLL